MLKVDKKASNKQLIRLSLLNDLEPYGDITCEFSIGTAKKANGLILAKEGGVLACSYLAQEILDECRMILKDELPPKFDFAKATIDFHFKDGDCFKPGDTVAVLEGPAHVLLSAERTVLNFLQRLSGVATYTKKLKDIIKEYPVKLLDTRKTMPGMRALGKEAVLCGGGANHRFNLSDMILIKENHLIFAGAPESKSDSKIFDVCDLNKHADGFEKQALKDYSSLEIFIKQVRKKLLESSLPAKENIKIECEVEKFEQLEPVIKAEVDVIMLDNFSPEDCKKAIEKIKALKEKHGVTKDIKIEASGGINERNILDYAKAGVDFVSVGALTNKPANIDLSMLIEPA